MQAKNIVGICHCPNICKTIACRGWHTPEHIQESAYRQQAEEDADKSSVHRLPCSRVDHPSEPLVAKSNTEFNGKHSEVEKWFLSNRDLGSDYQLTGKGIGIFGFDKPTMALGLN